MLLKKNILILVEEKKNKSDSEFMSYKLMLNSGKNFVLCATKNINILTLVLSENKILNERKNNNSPPPSS